MPPSRGGISRPGRPVPSHSLDLASPRPGLSLPRCWPGPLFLPDPGVSCALCPVPPLPAAFLLLSRLMQVTVWGRLTRSRNSPSVSRAQAARAARGWGHRAPTVRLTRAQSAACSFPTDAWRVLWMGRDTARGPQEGGKGRRKIPFSLSFPPPSPAFGLSRLFLNLLNLPSRLVRLDLVFIATLEGERRVARWLTFKGT